MILEFALMSMTVAMVLTIWFKTNAFVEYAEFLGLTHVVQILKDYKVVSLETPSLLFVDFVAENCNTFFSRLITCPICTATWLSIILTLTIGKLSLLCPVAFLGLFLYLILAKLL